MKPTKLTPLTQKQIDDWWAKAEKAWGKPKAEIIRDVNEQMAEIKKQQGSMAENKGIDQAGGGKLIAAAAIGVGVVVLIKKLLESR